MALIAGYLALMDAAFRAALTHASFAMPWLTVAMWVTAGVSLAVGVVAAISYRRRVDAEFAYLA